MTGPCSPSPNWVIPLGKNTSFYTPGLGSRDAVETGCCPESRWEPGRDKPYPSLENRVAEPTLSSGLERRADEGEREKAEWD